MDRCKHKYLVLILMAVAILSLSIGTTYAYLSTVIRSAENKFSPATEKDPAILETTDVPLTLKENVSVSVGDPGYAVYVRAAIVVTWEDDSGNVYGQKPEIDTEYFIDLNLTDWFYKNGFYYHKKMVNSGGTTADLIEKCYQILEAPTGYKLHVEIISQTIQAAGTVDGGTTPAVTNAWGIAVNSTEGSSEYGQLVDPNP